MRLLAVFLVLCFCYMVTLSSGVKTTEPMIAVLCGKNTQHVDLSTGQWVTSGNVNCMQRPEDMLAYCQKIYPQLSITNVLKENKKFRINSWCNVGNPGPTCNGHAHSVVPFKCVAGAFQSPALKVAPGCVFQHVQNTSICQDHDDWATIAREQCQSQSMTLQDNFSPMKPCEGTTGMWHAVEFVCCHTQHKTKSSKVVAVNKQPLTPKKPGATLDPRCTLPKLIGMCRAAFDAWYFDGETGQCRHFIYGGCGGNANNFENVEDCQSTCSGKLAEKPSVPVDELPVFPGLGPVLTDPIAHPQEPTVRDPICSAPSEVGLCKASFRRWFFNSKTERCETFTFGGCGGNANNFRSQQNCETACAARAAPPSTTTETTPATSSSSTTESTTTYFDADLDPSSEQKQYMDSVQQELAEHQTKLSKLMSDWDEANTQLIQNLDVDPTEAAKKSAQLQQDFERTKSALMQEHQQKKDQLSSAHEARMDAVLMQNRQTSFNTFMQELNVETPNAKKVLHTLKSYVRSEKHDHDHTANYLASNSANNEQLQGRLQTIQDRVVNAFQLIQQHPEIMEEIEDELDAYMDDMLPSFSFELDVTEVDVVAELPIIDEGGLPAENNGGDVEVYDDGDEDEFEDDPFDKDNLDDEIPTPDDDIEILDGEDLDEVLDDDTVDEDYDETTEDESVLDDTDMDETSVHSASAFGFARDDEEYSEMVWLKWVAVAAAGMVFLICVLAIVRMVTVRRRMAHSFTRIKVDDHLTAEERQLLQMQQNGYENPTYKFFEKQQIA